MEESITNHEFDVIVIGAGGAGLRAAIEASRAGVSVGMICKSMLGKAHTVMAEGGAAAALANKDPRDSWHTHFRDTLKGGKYLGDWRMAQIHAQQAPDRIRELEQWGAVFDRTPKGLTSQRNFGGHTYPRLAHIGDATGLELIRTLQQKGIHEGMEVFMEYTVRRLFKTDGKVSGCFAYDRNDGSLHVFKAKTIVLATGGITRCWEVCSGSWEYSGEGHALAYWAGAEMGDMEFVQFFPIAHLAPRLVGMDPIMWDPFRSKFLNEYDLGVSPFGRLRALLVCLKRPFGGLSPEKPRKSHPRSESATKRPCLPT